jgi:acyl carrier protein
MDRAQLRGVLCELIEETTGEPCPHLTDEHDLREGLGLDSVDLFSLVVETQSRFGIKIGSEELMNVARVSDFLDLVQAKLGLVPQASGVIEAA